MREVFNLWVRESILVSLMMPIFLSIEALTELYEKLLCCMTEFYITKF